MGAIPYDGGVTFRVWAKFPAQGKVSVVGDFNGWNTTANPLAPDGDSGYWSVDVPGAKVGDQYLIFIPGAPGSGYRVDPYATSIAQDASGNMHAVVTARDTKYQGGYSTPGWNEAVIYELHIPTFSTVGATGPGNFDTALTKLPALADLGVNAIEIMPLGQFQGVSATGYNPGYIFAVEDTYGGPDEFRDFVNQSHSMGLAVIVDVVYNHLGNTDLWQFDGWFTPGQICPFPHCNQVPTQGGIYFYQDARAHTDFAHTRFDFGRPEVQQYLVDNAMRWLQDRFVDGLRFDSVVNIRGVQVGADYEFDIPDGKALLARINQELQNSQPWKLTIAEDLQNNWSAITQPVEEGGFGFGAQWNNNFCFALRNAVLPSDDGSRPVQEIGREIAAMSGDAAFKTVIYSENHDRDDPGQGGGRVNDMISPGASDSWPAKKRSTLAAAVVLTAPGIPMLFQGQEFLEFRPFPTSGDPDPAPIDWGLHDKFAGIRSLYRDLIHLRRNWFNNTRGLRGANTHVLPVFADNVLVYHRWDQGGAGDDVVVVCNFANQGYASYAVGFPQGGMWRVRFNSDAGNYDEFFGNWKSFDTVADGPALNGMPCSGNVGIGPYSCVILSQD
jgi:1,4-alpha-glucan branching enzyme